MMLKHIDKMESRFEELKAEILRRAREAEACKEQYGRAYGSSTMEELMGVVKDNFSWACRHGVLTSDLIEAYREEFAAHDIFCNVNVGRGYLLCDNATVEAWDNATVEANGNATVKANGNATVKAYHNATVKAYDNATVEAYHNAYCYSYSIKECKLSGNAIYRVIGENTVYFANENIKFKKQV